MENPVQIAKDLYDEYLRYIESSIPINNDSYKAERHALYEYKGANEDSPLMKSPIIELTPKYKKDSDLTISQICKKYSLDSQIAEFMQTGLFYDCPDRTLYEHQEKAITSFLVEHKNFIATTGTGSGKTECFLIPILSNLVTESKKW